MRVALMGVAFAALLLLTAPAAVAKVTVVDGTLTWDLDLQALQDQASNTLGGVSPLVEADFTNGIFRFPIMGPDNAPFAVSTLSYDPANALNTFEGEIATVGTLFFEDENMVLGSWVANTPNANGDFGFYNAGFPDFVVFDARTDLSTVVASAEELSIEGDLLASAAFANSLLELGLATADITGVKLGTFQVEATVVPLPAGVVLLATAVAALGAVRARAARRAETS